VAPDQRVYCVGATFEDHLRDPAGSSGESHAAHSRRHLH
jgi:hypothetical protein